MPVQGGWGDAHARTHTPAPAHTRTHTHTQTHANTHASTRTHTHTHARTHACTHAHTHKHTSTHTHTCTHSHTHARTHTPPLNPQVFELGTDVDPVEIARRGVEEGRRLKVDAIIVDTAGRLQVTGEGQACVGPACYCPPTTKVTAVLHLLCLHTFLPSYLLLPTHLAATACRLTRL